MPDTKLSAIPVGTSPAFFYGYELVSGSPTPRKYAGLGWYNVRRYGALANGSDDSGAIQSAINAALGSGGGTVFFPAGTYTILSSLTLSGGGAPGNNAFIELIGAPGQPGFYGTQIQGNFNGYLLTTNGNTNQPLGHVHGIAFTNTFASAGGCCFIEGGLNLEFSHCQFSGFIGSNHGNKITYPTFSTDNAFCSLYRSCNFNGPPTPRTAGSIGLACGNVSEIIGCNFSSWDNAIRLFGISANVIGCRFETNNTAITIGVDDIGGFHQLTGGQITGCQTERNGTFLHCVQGAGLLIAGNAITGTTGPNCDDGYKVTATTSSGATSLTLVSLTGAAGHTLVNGDFIGSDTAFPSIPPNTTITLVSGTTITLSHALTGTLLTSDNLCAANTNNKLFTNYGMICDDIEESAIYGNSISGVFNLGGLALGQANQVHVAANKFAAIRGPGYTFPPITNQSQLYIDPNSNDIDGSAFITSVFGGRAIGQDGLGPTFLLNNISGGESFVLTNVQYNWPIGFTATIILVNLVSTGYTISGGGGATVNGIAGALALTTLYQTSFAKKIGANSWIVWN